MFLENGRTVQYASATIVSLMGLSVGTYLSWSSPALPLLNSGDTPIGAPITDEEGTWIVSILMLVSLPFNFTAGLLAEKIGRKMALLCSAILLTVPWIIIIFGETAVIVCVARSIAGIGVPLVPISCAMYTGEIADSDIRGKLATIYRVMMAIGSVIVLSIGPFVSYVWLAIVCLIFPLLFIILIFFIPESPYYLVKIRKLEQARKVLKQITVKSSNPDHVEKRLKDIETTIENDLNNQTTKNSFWELLTNRMYRRSAIIMAGAKTLQLLSGDLAIGPYMQTIVESADSSISPEISSILFGIVAVPAVLATTIFVDRLGRKPLFIISALGAAISLIAEGIFFYMQDYLEADTSSISWIPTTALILFLFTTSFGVTTIPYILLGELFATNVKGIATSLAMFYTGLLGFLLSKFFLPVSESIGIYSSFWIFAGCCILGAIFVYFVVPETKGKSFDEIQMKLKRNVESQPQKF